MNINTDIDNTNDNDNIDDHVDSLPNNVHKLIKKFDNIRHKFSSQKKNFDEINQEIKLFEKSLNKILQKLIKNDKPKTPRKKSGFALPSNVTTSLCEFMELEKGTQIARTDVTKYLMNYIKEKKLENTTNKRVIDPDEKLWKLLGDEAKENTITHFTIQKYINKHFIHDS